MISTARAIPANIDRAKRIARKIQTWYHGPLAACQATLAEIYGHNDWYALEQAIKHETITTEFDEAISDPKRLYQRRRAQASVLCRQFNGIDSMQEYPLVPLRAHLPLGPRMEYPLLDKFGDLAQNRYAILFAYEFIHTFQPTSKVAPPHYPSGDVFAQVPAKWLTDLPSKLTDWLSQAVPAVRPSEVGLDNDQPLDINSTLSLLKFGKVAGRICTHYFRAAFRTIDTGVTLMLAERYADIRVTHLDEFQVLINQPASDVSKDELLRNAALRAKHTHFVDDFLLSFTYDHPARLRQRGWPGFRSDVQRAVEIFEGKMPPVRPH